MSLKGQEGENDGQGGFFANRLRFTVGGEGSPVRNVDKEREAREENTH